MLSVRSSAPRSVFENQPAQQAAPAPLAPLPLQNGANPAAPAPAAAPPLGTQKAPAKSSTPAR
jgi:hypothetical protein